MKPHKHRFRQWLLVLLGLLSWLLGAALILWLTIPRWLPPLIAHFAAPLEIDMKVREVGIDHSVVEDIETKMEAMHLKVPKLSVTYSPRELVAGKVKTIMLSDALLDLDLTREATPKQQQETPVAAAPELKSVLNTHLPELPVEELLVNNFTLNLISESGDTVSPKLDLQANRIETRWDARANLTLHDARLDGLAYLSEEEEVGRGFELTFDIPNPLALAKQSASLLPATAQDQIETLPLEIGGFSGALDWKNTSGVINLQALLERLSYENLIEADTVFFDAKSSDYLGTLEATLFAQQLSLTDIGSAHIEAKIDAGALLTDQPNIQADLTVTDIELANLLPVKVETTSEEGIELTSHVSFIQKEDPMQGLESRSFLKIPASTLAFEISPEQKFATGVEGQLHIDQKQERVALASLLKFRDISYSDAIGLNLNGEARCELFACIPDILSLETFDVFKSLNAVKASGTFRLQGDFAGTAFSLDSSAMEIAQNTHDREPGFSGNLHIDHAVWDVWELIGVNAEAVVRPETAEVKLSGKVLNPSLEAEVTYRTDLITMQEGRVEVHTSSDFDKSTVKLQRLDTTLPETIAEGVIKAVTTLGGTFENPSLGLTLELEDGSMTMPESNMSLSGINLPKLQIDNLLTGSGPVEQEIRIGEIDFPPNRISDVQVVFDPLVGFGVNIRKLTFRFCDGLFEIDFAGPIQAPYTSFEFDLKFSGVDIEQLTKLIPDFKDEIEGRIEGHIPVVFRDGRISWKEGYARLVEGTTCVMRYSENGLVATYVPKIEISKKLDIDVNDALRDITITKLDIQLRSSEQFSEPSVVTMSGHSNNPKLEIPIEKIQLNIRAADIPSILNETLQQSKWFEWLNVKGKMNEQLSSAVK